MEMTPCTAAIPRMTQQQFQHQRPVVDLLVAIIAVPTLIVFALQLEKNMQNKWADDASTKWIVLGLGVGMLIISLLICGYVTHRMGVCLWTGPLEDTTPAGPTLNHIPSQNDILRIIDSLPPSYESVTKFEIPPPPYDCVVINIETKDIPIADTIADTSTHI